MNDRSECQQCHSPEPVVTVVMRLEEWTIQLYNGDNALRCNCAASFGAGLRPLNQLGWSKFHEKLTKITNGNARQRTKSTNETRLRWQ